MTDVEWFIVVLLSLSGGVMLPFGWRWYRRRRTAKAADQLLADVLKGKDAFRR